MNISQINRDFFAGFTLAGYEKDGKIIGTTGHATMDKWPEEITVQGVTFTLEYVERVGEEEFFCNAQYV